MASADFSLRLSPSPFQAQNEISPGKNALLHCTTAGFTPPRLDHESFVVCCPLALLGSAFYPILVHRLAASIHASSPQSVTLMQLRFTSFAVINLRWDLHPQEYAHAGRTTHKNLAVSASLRELNRRRLLHVSHRISRLLPYLFQKFTPSPGFVFRCKQRLSGNTGLLQLAVIGSIRFRFQ